jgi:hypothetical protein
MYAGILFGLGEALGAGSTHVPSFRERPAEAWDGASGYPITVDAAGEPSTSSSKGTIDVTFSPMSSS